jgi:hypothetical protein
MTLLPLTIVIYEITIARVSDDISSTAVVTGRTITGMTVNNINDNE